MQPLLNIAINAARLAGNIVLRFSEQTHRLKIQQKKDNDFYSEVDIKAEQEIINTILKAYPQHSIISEEHGNIENKPEYTWIIDPLDGTRNYLQGFPFYCVSIAVLYKNIVEHAVIYDPLRHECFAASRGNGARMNSQRIRVSKKIRLAEAMLSLQLPVRNSQYISEHTNWYNQAAKECSGIRCTGSAGLDLAYVAAGRIDVCILKYLQIWDIAAGSLLVQEAGGFIADTDGSDNFLKSGNIIAATPKIFTKLQKTISA